MGNARSRLSRSEIALLAVTALYIPLEIRLGNLSGLPQWHLVAFAGLISWLLAVAMASLGLLLRIPKHVAVWVSLTSLLLFTQGNWLNRFSGGVAALLIAGILTFVILLVLQLERLGRVEWLTIGLACFLGAGLIIAATRSVIEWGHNYVRVNQVFAAEVSNNGDVYLIVFDGYVGRIGWGQSSYFAGEPSWHKDLSQLDFQIPQSAWASYPWTQTSLASLLSMDYPVVGGEVVNGSTRSGLYAAIGGSNPTVMTFHEAGYETVMLESPWHGSSCGSFVDRCIGTGFRSEEFHSLIGRSVASEFVQNTAGHAFASASVYAMEWLKKNAPTMTDDGAPQFLFAHLMIPHPPFMLDAKCKLRYDPNLSTFSFPMEGVPIEIRAIGYVEQASCANSFMRRFAQLLPATDTVIYVADHGSDSRGQFDKPLNDWDIEDLTERFNVLMAVRSPRCDLGNSVILPNVMRRVLTCLGGAPLSDVPDRMFVHQISERIHELDPGTVVKLLGQP